MRTKKLFSLLLAVLMLCSLSVSAFAAETAQASVPVVLTVVNSVSPISVSVPACLPVTVLDGYVVTASNAVIENRAQSGAVQVVAVDVQPGAFAIGVAVLLDLALDLAPRLFNGFLDARRMDASVLNQAFERDTRNFTFDGVMAGKRKRPLCLLHIHRRPHWA